MFYFDLYFINVYVILPPDLGPFAVNKYIHTCHGSVHENEVHWNMAEYFVNNEEDYANMKECVERWIWLV
jgi:hypothetical protein